MRDAKLDQVWFQTNLQKLLAELGWGNSRKKYLKLWFLIKSIINIIKQRTKSREKCLQLDVGAARLLFKIFLVCCFLFQFDKDQAFRPQRNQFGTTQNGTLVHKTFCLFNKKETHNCHCMLTFFTILLSWQCQHSSQRWFKVSVCSFWKATLGKSLSIN